MVVPVWFIVEGEELVFNTGKTSAKGKALARDNRVALCVDLEQEPYAFVQVQGTATLSEDLDELVRTAAAIGSRYMGADRAEEFGKRNGVPGAGGAGAAAQGHRGLRYDRLNRLTRMTVHFIGAGPGAADLLTVRAVELLRSSRSACTRAPTSTRRCSRTARPAPS